MTAWVELPVIGGHNVLLDASAVAAVILPKGGDVTTMAVPRSPADALTILMRGGETIPPVYGVSGEDLMVAISYARAAFKESDKPMVILYWKDLPRRVAECREAAGAV